MPTLLPFFTFKAEAAIIGRLLAGYTNLEIDLFHCVQIASGDFDTALKTMFKIRGETNRILQAAKLGEPLYKSLKLDSNFRSAINVMRWCLKIRNQYTHSVWWNDLSGHLAFANIEEIARLPDIQTDLKHLPVSHICEHILKLQEDYFAYCDRCFIWVNFEGRYRAQKLSTRIYPKPRQMKRPPLRSPPEGCSSQATYLGLKPIPELRASERRSSFPSTQTPPSSDQP